MNTYKRHRFPPDVTSYAVWLYDRFNLSHRDIEDLLAERSIIVSRESIRLWCIKFGAVDSRSKPYLSDDRQRICNARKNRLSCAPQRLYLGAIDSWTMRS
jgi:transposase-like protein